jgi:small subunit ribosomal protein S6
MRPYEMVVLLHPDLEIDIDTPIAKVIGLVENAGGKVTKKDNWGKKRLAYPIKKQQFAIYAYLDLDLPTEQVRQLESSLLITEEVMRFLIVNRLPQASKKVGEKEDDAKQPVAAAVEENE